MIRKVWLNKSTQQKCITLEKGTEIETGDYVRIIKVEDQDGKTKKE